MTFAAIQADHTAHQTPLSLRWQTRHHWTALCKKFGGDETTAAVILTLVTSNERTSYSRSPSHYLQPRRYRSRLYTYRKVVGAVDHLDDQGLIEHDRRRPGLRGWQSSMKATPELIARTREVLSISPRLEIARPTEGIILRDAAGKLIDYQDGAMTMRMRRRLEQFNEAIRSTDIISDNVASPMVRIFNRTFGRGGRFYALGGGWQSMKKELRKRIMIGGEPVVEIDFKTLHPAILYAQADARLPADAYAVDGWPRALVKVALLVLINARNRASARLTRRIRELAERYERPLSRLEGEIAALTSRIEAHLKKMGASWK